MVADDALVIEQPGDTTTQLYPWKGGFLAVHTQFLSPSLPTELPPEIVEQFPQEVRDLFPDGLPPTLEEATVVLQEAGLFDVVAEIVASDPDVSEAIYAGEPDVITTFRFSEDGTEWTGIEAELPTDPSSFPTFASTGERFVTVSPVAEGADPVDNPTSLDVWSSTDLVNWERQVVALPSAPADLPEFVETGTYVNAVVANDDAWVVSLNRFTQIDPYSLLDDEQQTLLDVGGYSTSSDDTGVTFEVYAGESEPGPSETIEFTWAELGIDEPLAEEDEAFSFTAQWGGDPVETVIGVADQYGLAQTIAIDSGFVSLGSDLRLSADGVQWSPVQLPDGGTVDWVIETDAGLLVGGSDDEGNAFRLLFDPVSSEFSPVDLGDAPESGWAQLRDRNAVVVEDFGDDQGDPFGSFGSLASVETNGYLFELTTTFADDEFTASYVLTEVATGEVVSTETIDQNGADDFEFAKEVYDVPDGEEGFRVFDPESSEVLLEAPFDEFVFVQLDAEGEPIPDSEFQLPDPEEYEPGPSWLIASVGDSLVIEQIDGSNGESYLTSVAVQGDVVLVARNDGTMTRVMADD